MIPPTPGADPASRLFGFATPPDGAGPIGPDQLWPTPVAVTHEEFMRGLNPLHHLPVVGTIYRAVTGETIPTTMKVLGAGIFGGPAGMLLSGFAGILQALFTLKPDLSRPQAPAGMTVTGSEAGVQPVTPGSLTDGNYTTLATATPEWLSAPPTQFAEEPTRGQAAYRTAAIEYRRAELLEKGIA